MAYQLVAGRFGILAPGALLAVLACTGAGCSSTTPPGLDIVGVTIGEETPQALVLVFSLQGSNTNEFPLPLGEVRYELDLAGERVFEGVRSAQVTLPRGGVRSIELPTSFQFGGVEPALDGPTPYRLVGHVRYRPDGTFPSVLYDSAIYRPSRSFSVSGVLDFSPVSRTGPFPEGEPSEGSIHLGDPQSP